MSAIPNHSLITTALKKCGIIPHDCDGSINRDDLILCLSYIEIDGKTTQSEIFDALCKRLMEHYLPGFDPAVVKKDPLTPPEE